MGWPGQARIKILSARSAGEAGADADGAADLDAGVRALDRDKSRAIRRAWIGRRAALQAGVPCPILWRPWPSDDRTVSASATEADSVVASSARSNFMPPFIAPRPPRLRHEFDANRLAAAPDHFAGPAGPRVARERKPQFGRQRVGIVNRDLRARGRHILHHAGPRREAALERDPSGLAAAICASRASWFRTPCQPSQRAPKSSPKAPGFKNRCKHRRFSGITPAPAPPNRPRKKPVLGGLPARAIATIRSRRRRRDAPSAANPAHRPLKALICRLFLLPSSIG